jgi:hypothetical protein
MTRPATLPPLPPAARILRAAPALQLAAPSKRLAAEEPAAALPAAEFQMVCRTAEPVELGYAKLAHDFSTFNAPTLTPCDYCHDVDDIVGNCSDYRIEGEAAAALIKCKATVESIAAGDTAGQIIARAGSARAPVPYQASIEWEGDVELLIEGSKPVNGVDVPAPAYIVTNWTIKQMAICPQGADPDTSTELATRLSAEAAAAPTKLADETPAAETTDETPPADPPADEPATCPECGQAMPAAETEAETPPVEASAEAETPPPAETLSRAELSQFATAFGADAIGYLTAGLNYHQALEKHLAKLSGELTSERSKAGELEKRLAKPPIVGSRGEPSALSAVPTGAASTDLKYGHLGKLAAAAASSRFTPPSQRQQAERN